MVGALPEDLGALLGSTTGLAIVLALGVILLLLTLLAVRGSVRRGRTILILGPCNAGKTALWLQLREGGFCRGTVASMQENDDTFELADPKGGKSSLVNLVDVPGHPRVRRAFERRLPSTRGIVFVVDSLDFLPHKTEIAEQLYEVLAARGAAGRRLPVLLAANKSDHGPKAHTPDFVRRRLERELDALRATRAAQPAAGGSGDAAALGKPSEPLTFESLARSKGARVLLPTSRRCLFLVVSVAPISATAGDVQPVIDFIHRCLPP